MTLALTRSGQPRRAADIAERLGMAGEDRECATMAVVTFGRRCAVAATLALLVSGSGCSSGAETTARPFHEFRVMGVRTFTRHREVTCSSGGVGRCRRSRATAAIQYNCGERSAWISTKTGSPFAIDRAHLGNARRVKVRGHWGSLYFVDTGDPILYWREAPNVWVQFVTEDLSLRQPQVISLMSRLEDVRWGSQPPRAQKTQARFDPQAECTAFTRQP